MPTKLEALRARWSDINRLQQVASLLGWDMETYMPEEGTGARAGQLSLVSELAHRMLVDEETGRLIDGAAAETAGLDYFSDEASIVRVARRLYERQSKIPAAFVARFADTTARANAIWMKARGQSDFSLFAPVLTELVELNREQARLLGYRDHPYDALLDLYEPGMTTAQVSRLFADVKEGLLPLIRDIRERDRGAGAPFMTRSFPVGKQEEFGLRVLGDMGFDFKRGRQDRSAHPFTVSMTPLDVRITTRYTEHNFMSALFGSIHEGGHALYDQGLPLHLADTPLCEGISLGVHESQSRLWENMVGRSRTFWAHYFPLLGETFPGILDGVGLDEFYREINRVIPSLIRVEADEVTYNLHIFVRFELELELIGGGMRVEDLPSAWNEKYRHYLGIEPDSDANGCLQDIHWAHGSFGYFPTYTVGTVLAAQLFDRARADLPGLDTRIGAGDLRPLRAWLLEKIHAQGARYTPIELAAAVAGGEINAGPYLKYLTEKYADLYRLT